MNTLEPLELRIATIAQSMLSGAIGLIEGCREIAGLVSRLDDSEDELLRFIVAVDSETDDLPIGEARCLWEEDALRKKDAEVAVYLSKVRGELLETCGALVQRYSRDPS